MKIYKNKPLYFSKNIPVFSNKDEYILNYEKICADHVEKIKLENDNPWISNKVWESMEFSTSQLFDKYLSLLGVENPKVLDVGVGLGRLLHSININNAIEPYGMDIALPYLEIAQTKGIDVCCSKIEDMPYLNDTFDIILCTDVLEHVIDLNACVTKILSVLKKGGLLIVRVPFKEDLSPYLKDDYPYEYVHLRNFDCTTLETLFTKIFKHEVLEFKPGLYEVRYNWLKYNLPTKQYWRILHRFITLVSKFSDDLKDKLIKLLFHPIEINVVIKKV